MNKKILTYVASGLLVATLGGVVPGTARHSPPMQALTPVAPPLADLTPVVREAIDQAQQQGEQSMDFEFLVAEPDEIAQLKQEVQEQGGQILVEEVTYLRVHMPVAAAEQVIKAAPVRSMGTNHRVTVSPAAVATEDQPLDAASLPELAAISTETMGIDLFRQRYSASGKGVRIAVVDTGVDPAHQALRSTPDGRVKVTDWKDFTGEGKVDTPHTVAWSGTYQAPNGRSFVLPDKPAASGTARFGYWQEYRVSSTYYDRDLDRNDAQTDQFGVLVVDSTSTGTYDTVYVDTNNNGSFRDETPLHLYTQDQSVGYMGRFREGRLAVKRLPIAVADLSPTGQWVSLGFDAHGHGTQVAGVLGAYSPSGLSGVAPGVEIMALKAIGSTGEGDWFNIWQAIRYAARQGADVINVSVGNLVAASGRNTASDLLNQLAREYGVLIVLAADNTGPGLSSGATLGSPSEMLAVGAYYSPAMWKRDKGYIVPNESIWWQSGMGPRSDGSYVPNVVAPGGGPTTSPLWLHSTGYTTEVGTSIATPYASGTAALLIEAAQSRGVLYDRLSVKRALELGARKIPGFDVFEQGNGLIAVEAAYNHLQKLTASASLKAVSAEGNGGILARSYTPGSNLFLLTHLGNELARVNIYSSETWVKPGLQSLTLPPGVARQLPIQFEPPKGIGVYSAFLQVTHQNQYGPSVTIPVTYVNPHQFLAQNEHRYTRSDSLEVARYRRYFFQIKPGADRFDVTARVLPGLRGVAQGTIMLNVFRPDGQAVHRSVVGLNGNGLTALFHTDQPVEGVWEVVVTALPDERGEIMEAAYSLDATAPPGPMANLPAKLSMAPGASQTFALKVGNLLSGFTGRVEAIGLSRLDSADPWNAGVPWRVVRRQQSVVEEFTLGRPTQLMRIEVSNPVPAVDLALYLYYFDPIFGWQQRGQLAGEGEKYIEVSNLPAGRYQVLSAVVNGSVPPNLQFQYRRLVGADLVPVQLADTARRHERGESWNVPLAITAPTVPGRYIGHVLLRDTERGTTLKWVTYELSVGQSELSVQPMVAQLVRGVPSDVVLELREAASLKPVDGTVTVNGQRYSSRNGKVTVTLMPQGNTQILDVEADLPNFRPLQTRITVPVRASWGSHPIGSGLSEEIAGWRRKVLSVWP